MKTLATLTAAALLAVAFAAPASAGCGDTCRMEKKLDHLLNTAIPHDKERIAEIKAALENPNLTDEEREGLKKHLENRKKERDNHKDKAGRLGAKLSGADKHSK